MGRVFPTLGFADHMRLGTAIGLEEKNSRKDLTTTHALISTSPNTLSIIDSTPIKAEDGNIQFNLSNGDRSLYGYNSSYKIQQLERAKFSMEKVALTTPKHKMLKIQSR